MDTLEQRVERVERIARELEKESGGDALVAADLAEAALKMLVERFSVKVLLTPVGQSAL